MNEPRFFYSTDGTDVQGPVTLDDLRQLFATGGIRASSFLCPEGETEWQPVNPEFFAPPPPPPIAAMPPPRPPPAQPPPYRPEASYSHRSRSSSRSRRTGGITTAVGWFIAVGVAALIVIHNVSAPSYHQSYAYTVGSFIGSLFGIVILPYLVSFCCPRRSRSMVVTVGIAAVSLLMLAGTVSESGEQRRLLAAASDIQKKTASEAQQQIKTQGYFSPDPQEAQKDLQKLKDQVGTGDSMMDRVARDLLTVTDQLMQKSNAAQAAGKACNFDPTTITGPDDIANRHAAIEKLHDTEEDMVVFLQNIDANCRDVLSAEHLSDQAMSQTIAGFRQSGHVDLLIVLWQAQAKLAEDHLARLDLLSRTWGKWSAKDGKMVFNDDDTVSAYNDLLRSLQDDVKKIGDTQKQIFQ